MPNPVPGVLQQAFIKEQSTFDTVVAYAATDAVSPVIGTFKIEPEKSFEKLKEACATASLQGEVALNRGGKWSGTFYVKPAAAGTAPDIGPALLKAGCGVETITGSTSAAYTLSDTVNTALQGCLHVDSNLQHVFSGGWVEELTLEAVGNNIPTISVSGGFARFGWAYADVIATGGIATGDAQCNLADASRGSFYPGAVVQIGDDTNGGAGYAITSVDYDAGDSAAITAFADAGGGQVTVTSAAHGLSNGDQVTIAGTTNYNGVFIIANCTTNTFEITDGWVADDATGTWTTYAHFHFTPVLAGAGESAGEAIVPLVPSQTTGGTVIGATECSLTIDSISLGFISCKVTISTGIGPRDKEATADRANGLVRTGARVVEAELQCYLLDSNTGNAPIIGRAWEGTTRDVDIRIGANTAGERMLISLPKARVDIATIDVGEDIVTANFKLVARQNSAAADEFTLTFN